MCPAGIFQLAGSCMCRADSVSVRPQVVDQDPVPVCGTLSGSSSPMIAPRVAAPSSSPFQPTPTPPIALRSAPRIKPAPRVRNKSPQNHSGTHQDVPFPRDTSGRPLSQFWTTTSRKIDINATRPIGLRSRQFDYPSCSRLKARPFSRREQRLVVM